MANPDELFPYTAMCTVEGVRLRRGMNYRIKTATGPRTIILTSERKDAPYSDQFSEDGRLLLYEGHDAPRSLVPNPKTIDQQLRTVAGTPNENGKFWEAARRYKTGGEAEVVSVWEKLVEGQWRWRGEYRLVDAGWKKDSSRKVVEFRLEKLE